MGAHAKFSETLTPARSEEMQSFCILHVEDEECDVLFMREAFKRVGITNPVQVVRDGDDAIQYLAGQGKYANRADFPLPTLVLLDLKLPAYSGFEVLKWLRAQPQTRKTLVVVISASPNRRDITAAYEQGANGYLVKPTGLTELVEKVKSIRDYWLVSNVPPV